MLRPVVGELRLRVHSLVKRAGLSLFGTTRGCLGRARAIEPVIGAELSPARGVALPRLDETPASLVETRRATVAVKVNAIEWLEFLGGLESSAP